MKEFLKAGDYNALNVDSSLPSVSSKYSKKPSTFRLLDQTLHRRAISLMSNRDRY